MKKAGIVGIIGRPNAGKSTLLNALLGKKVTITSPKPNTTQFSIEAVYEDEQGQIIFVDTPGLTSNLFHEKPDVIVYLIDHTRDRGTEENKTLGIVRKFSDVRKILAFNKVDVVKPSYKAHYKFLEEEFDDILEVSALKGTHLKSFISIIFKYLPEREPIIDTALLPTPLINVDSKMFIAELIREKIFLSTGQELPYRVRVVTDEITERKNGNLYIKAHIITDSDRHKMMLIGHEGRKVKEIGFKTRKELELSTDKKVYLELTVESS